MFDAFLDGLFSVLALAAIGYFTPRAIRQVLGIRRELRELRQLGRRD